MISANRGRRAIYNSEGTNHFYWFSAASCQHPLFGGSTSAGAYTDEFIHFNGQAVGYRDDAAGKVYHLVNDHLGSARVMTNATGVTQFESDYYPHGASRVITSTKDSLLKFQGKQQDTESGLDNVRRMYSPTLARFLPTRVATVPAKPKKSKGVPAPQSLNPSSLAASNPVVHPNSLISNFINILFSPTPTPGSEGNNPCADFGCYPGPPDPPDFLDLIRKPTCNLHCILPCTQDCVRKGAPFLLFVVPICAKHCAPLLAGGPEAFLACFTLCEAGAGGTVLGACAIKCVGQCCF